MLAEVLYFFVPVCLALVCLELVYLALVCLVLLYSSSRNTRVFRCGIHAQKGETRTRGARLACES